VHWRSFAVDLSSYRFLLFRRLRRSVRLAEMRTLFAGILGMGLLLVPSPTRGADVSFFGVSKVVEYAQTPSEPPAVISGGYSFTAFAVATQPAALTDATVRRSNSQVSSPLLPQAGTDVAWLFQERFDSQSALDAAYPNGTWFNPIGYVVTLFTANDGVRSSSLNFWSVLGGYPAAPTMSNLEAAREIDTASSFTLTWHSLGGSSFDIVQLTIVDGASHVVFATPAPFQADALTAGSTSVVIPSNQLPSGADLIGNLLIARPGLPDTSYGTGLPALSKSTTFSLATQPLATAASLSVARNGENIEISWPASAAGFVLESTGDLRMPDWRPLSEPVMPDGNRNVVTITAPAGTQFFRLKK
jgi:hypothetical protein